MPSLYLERMSPANHDHLDRFRALLEASRNVPEVAGYLPEIFEEGSDSRIQEGIRANSCIRYLVVVERVDVGRVELTRHLNDDPSVTERIPEDVALGFNTCYFLNPARIGRGHELAHVRTADLSIKEAFTQGDKLLESSPWLPVTADGNDPSRGWLMQPESRPYTVHVGEPATGFFPQFGVDAIPMRLAYAMLG